MTSIRWLGILVGVSGFFFVFNRFRHGRARRIDFFWSMIMSFCLITVSAYPPFVSLLRDMLLLEQAQFSRLIAIIILSNILLWIFFFYGQFRWTKYIDQFDHLVRRLGVADFERYYPEIKSLPPVLVVIPAYNEADNLEIVLKAMPGEVLGRELKTLVIDDGSQDNTLEIARRGGVLAVKNPINRGGGAALRMGFDIARQYGVDIVVTMDADGQHLPSEIPDLVAPVLNDEVDFVIGSRILGKREKDSIIRYMGIHVFNTLIRLLTHVKITDCSNGFRAFRTSELARVLLRQDQFHTSELIIDAAKKRIRIGEVPVTVKRRHSGESKKGKNWRYGFSFFRTVFKTWWR
ncbi:glycosyltransferase, group 2 family protein [delta proteobacterium NaphS2]|nr:glycosyltransferase, group 2 family protein [delta proteobacterium NaphS2]